jgi:hypothetical protein
MHTQSQLLLLLLLQGIKRIAYLETAPMYRRRSSTPAPLLGSAKVWSIGSTHSDHSTTACGRSMLLEIHEQFGLRQAQVVPLVGRKAAHLCTWSEEAAE